MTALPMAVGMQESGVAQALAAAARSLLPSVAEGSRKMHDGGAAGPSHAAAGQARATPVESRTVSEQTDEQLLMASLDGDSDAFTRLVERYRNELLHFLIRFLGSRAAAEDVFQDTFLQIHLSAKSFDPERRFKPWLFTIAANKARDHYRRNQRKAPVSLSAPLGAPGESESFVDLLEVDLPAPDAPLADAERSRLVRTVIDQLPPHHREILLLSYFQRFSYNQIAEALQIPLGTVKSRLHAAVANFAAAWKSARASSDGAA